MLSIKKRREKNERSGEFLICSTAPGVGRVAAGLFALVVLPALAVLFAPNAQAQNATGKPTISGPPQVGETMTANTSGIADANGLGAFSYQWILVDGNDETDISNATSSTYSPVAADVGKKIKVKVSFTDGAGNAEAVTSDAYPSRGYPRIGIVAAKTACPSDHDWCAEMTVGFGEYPFNDLDVFYLGYRPRYEEGGYLGELSNEYWGELSNATIAYGDATYTVRHMNIEGRYTGVGSSSSVYIAFADGEAVPNGTVFNLGGTAFTADRDSWYVGSVHLGNSVNVMDNDLGNYIYPYPSGLNMIEGQKMTVSLKFGDGNSPASGWPWIRGTPRVGETLTVDTSDLTDNDGKTKAENGEAGYAYTYRWIRKTRGGTETDISASSTYTPVAADAGNSLRVEVSFIDDKGMSEGPLTSPATRRITSAAPSVSASFGAGAYTVNEGESVSVTVKLSADPEREVTIPLHIAPASDDYAIPSEVTFNAGDLEKSIVFTTTDDDIAGGDETVTINFGTLPEGVTSGSPASADVTIIDDDEAGVMFSTTALSVPEGGEGSYTVVLTSEPTGDVTVTPSLSTGSDADITLASSAALAFTASDWNEPQTVTVHAAEDDDTAPGSATIEHAVAGADYASVTASDVTVTEADNDAPGVRISPTTLTITEGASATYEVVLNTQPTGDVTVRPSLASGSDADITVSGGALTFTPSNWSLAQTVTVRAAEDDDTANGSATIAHAVAGADYAGVTASDVTVTEADNDTETTKDPPGVTVSPTMLTITEGATATYEVVLDTRPTGDVTVTPSLAAGSDADIAISAGSLTFTPSNWNEPQTVTVSAAEDVDAINGAATIAHAVAGADYAGVTASDVIATEADNDAVGVTVSPMTLTVTEGASATYEVVLNTQPTGDVTVTPSLASGSDADIGVHPTSLVFTPDDWSVAQEVTVSAAEDDDAINGAATIEHGVSGGNYADVTASSVTVTESDNDEAGVTVAPTELTVAEGASTTYTIVLDTQPSEDVTIAPSLATGSDADITVLPGSLTFTPDDWFAAQEVTVSAAEDADAENGTATITHAVSGGDYAGVTASSVTATESDNDEAGIVLPATLTVTEGSSAIYEVALETQPLETVTVAVTDAGDPDVDVSPSSLTFTPDNWSATQPVTVTAGHDDDADDDAATLFHTASGRGYDGVTAPDMIVTVMDDDTTTVTISVAPGYAMEGENTMSLTVALDQAHTLTVRVSYATSDDRAVAGQDYEAVDGTLVFSPGETSKTVQALIVNDMFDEEEETFFLTLSDAVHAVFAEGGATTTVVNTIMDDDERGVTVTTTELTVPEGGSATYGISLTSAPTEPITIDMVVTGDPDVTIAPLSLSFTSENWEAKQEITVSAAEDLDREDDTAMLSHKAAGGDYGAVTISDVAVRVIDESGRVDVSAWLARYSRVGADHLLSSVENRMESIDRMDRGASGAEVSIAGRRITFGASHAQPGMAMSGDSPARAGSDMVLSGASALWSASQDYTTSSLGGGNGNRGSGDSSVRSANSYGISPGLNAAASRYRNLTLRDALSRSAFRYARETDSGSSYGMWGQGSFSRFGGSEAGADITGDVMSGTVGIDHSVSGWLRGFAVSRSESEGAYRIAGRDSLALSASLTGIYPYARYKITDRLRVWGTGGLGGGSLRLTGDSLASASASSSSSLAMALGSVGMSGDIVSAGSSDGFGLSWQTDAMLLRSRLGSSSALSKVSATVHRLRLSLESSYILRMGERASLVPKVQLGVRRDGGDAEEGMGLDVAGGLGFAHPGWGLSAQVDMHGLLAHEDSDFEEWGVSGTILFDRSPSSALGPSLRLTPFWGAGSFATSGGMHALWSRETVSGLAGFRNADDGTDRSLRLDGRFDYGFTAFGEHGVTAPYASFSLSGNEAARAAGDTDVELGGGLGYSNKSLGLRMQAGMRGLMSDEAMGFDQWGASGLIAFDPDPSSPLGASFNLSQSWRIAPPMGFGGSQTGFGGSQTMGMRQPVTGLPMAHFYDRPLRVEGEMGYGFSASGGAGVMTPYAGVAYSDRGRSGVLLGFNFQTGRRFLLNLEGSTPENERVSLNAAPEFRVRGLLKW